MDAKTIAKYKKYSTSRLKKKAIQVFNSWVRARDKENGCISCGGNVDHAGHYYSAGHYDALRFNEDNCHGQCISCNFHKSGNLIKYGINLEKKIGKERIEKLHFLSDQSKKTLNKQNRIFYIEIIKNYSL